MIMATMSYCSVRCTNSQSTHVVRTASTVPVLCSFVGDLIKGGKNIISELNFCDWGVAFCCSSDSKSDDTLFSQRGVEDTVRAVPFTKTDCTSKDATKGNILAKDKRPVGSERKVRAREPIRKSYHFWVVYV